MKRSLSLAAAALLASVAVFATDESSVDSRDFQIEKYLDELRLEQDKNLSLPEEQAEKRQYQVINRKPYRQGAKQRVPFFQQKQIQGNDFVEIKDQLRQKKFGLKDDGQTRIGIEGNDQVEDLVQGEVIDNIYDMERLTKLSIAGEGQPWSDYYWPIYQGVLGMRYAENGFNGIEKDWKKYETYILANPPANASNVDELSPSEKYDLLLGDSNFTLTKQMWNQGKQYWRPNKPVETWMGVCHGWAPAAYMEARPVNAITVTAMDGRTKIKLYPSDIKALATLMWAHNDTASRFIGGRCNDKDPKKDRAGHVISQDCFDNNPGSWHMVVVNQLKKKESFVIDATYDYEVWNQPVVSANYTYFNPKTNKPARSLKDAVVAYGADAKTWDRFYETRQRWYRENDARKPKKLVGIAMDVTYVVENPPSASDRDHHEYDSLTTARYIYDLELDDDGKIIGGEWYQNTHPDFIWTPTEGAQANSVADSALAACIRTYKGGWDFTSVPSDAAKKCFGTSAKRASASGSGQPLNRVVKDLIVLSRAGVR